MRRGKQPEATAPFQSLLKLQPWFLSLRWKIFHQQNCSLGSFACGEGPALGHNTCDDDCLRKWAYLNSTKFIQNIVQPLSFDGTDIQYLQNYASSRIKNLLDWRCAKWFFQQNENGHVAFGKLQQNFLRTVEDIFGASGPQKEMVSNHHYRKRADGEQVFNKMWHRNKLKSIMLKWFARARASSLPLSGRESSSIQSAISPRIVSQQPQKEYHLQRLHKNRLGSQKTKDPWKYKGSFTMGP